ncbi:hypothetical protein [Kineococcus radiotolerans]|uniref:Uncharacterized protein n=1 Tax=Kineococcus radiotolerans (strain ATCC BAA-149 / DSM 14245 / SRS30216) TaxID=266940 RepID=A6WH66_KINRD|nr:hypothetical protein [Kineococcus radiotolerans]ABS06155.1 hypothetical protein Krad_4697 [Kineococcus radiotolerans SRS30216 = ATCC BAA-149]
MNFSGDYLASHSRELWEQNANDWLGFEHFPQPVIGCEPPPTADEVSRRLATAGLQVAREVQELVALPADQQEGGAAQACRARLEKLQAEMAMLSELREEMVRAGAPWFTRHDIVVGDEVLADGAWWEVARVNQRSLRVCPLDARPWRWVRGIVLGSELVDLDRVQARRTAAHSPR